MHNKPRCEHNSDIANTISITLLPDPRRGSDARILNFIAYQRVCTPHDVYHGHMVEHMMKKVSKPISLKSLNATVPGATHTKTRMEVLLKLLLMLLMMSSAGNSKVYAEHVTTDVVIIGAGISGITAGKTLSENGVTDFVILEATDKIGGRIRSDEFAGLTVELGANWVEGVNGANVNPIWSLAQQVNLQTFLSDTGNISSNIYDISGALPKQTKAQEATAAENGYVTSLGTSLSKNGEDDISVLTAQRLYGFVPSTPVEMVLDYEFYDGEFAEPPRVTSLKNTQPTPTFKTFGADSYFVADQRGYSTIMQPLGSYLKSNNGTGPDSRIKFEKVVKTIQYSEDGVTVFSEDGSTYSAKAAILSVSLGVLQSNLITFEPELPYWKLEAISEFDMAIYTKIFLKFPKSFWRTGNGTDFFLYADGSRGYYPIWQHMDNQYPDSHVLFVTVTDDESRRIELQSEKQTLTEVLEVLRKMFGPDIPDPDDILIPKWWSNRFFRGSFSNWPIGVTHHKFKALQAPIGRLFFAGEHTSLHYNGYVHGAYYSGIDSAKAVYECMQKKNCPATREDSRNTMHIRSPKCLESTYSVPISEIFIPNNFLPDWAVLPITEILKYANRNHSTGFNSVPQHFQPGN